MAVQDDKREKLMCKLLGLRRGKSRGGVDAHYDISGAGSRRISVPVELKSTTNNSVSTARDVGMNHIVKWRRRVWVFGFFDEKGRKLNSILCLAPSQMAPWIDKIEAYIKPDFAIGHRAAAKLDLGDLHVVCGEKEIYSRQDAENLHKKQWSKEEYLRHMDLEDGYSPVRMLEILRLRALYLNDRGSTLNNPHIPDTFFRTYADKIFPADPLSEDHKKSVVSTMLEAYKETSSAKA